MVRRNLLPVWIGIVFLSGMFLMGQESWAPPTCTDLDGDSYGNPVSAACTHPELDCDDGNNQVNPGMIEAAFGDPICSDGLDNDCDTLTDIDDNGCQQCAEPLNCDDGNPCTDDDCVAHVCVYANNTNPCDDQDPCTVNDVCTNGACIGALLDADGDGHVSNACGGDDCDDANPAVHPGAAEVCNGIDDDCDTVIDEENAQGCATFYLDADADTYGVTGDSKCLCAPEGVYTATQDGDCDDANPDVYPGAVEKCDNVDNQCPGDPGYGEVDEGCDMVSIPAGCYAMGDAFTEGGTDERPVHNVCISAFEIDVHELTNVKYAACVAAGVCTPPSPTTSLTRTGYYGVPAYNNYPVIYVTWDQANAYCTWADKRLPTEAEWEYAARGGEAGRRYPWGDDLQCSYANYGRQYSWDPCWNNGGLPNDTHPVDTYAANGYGVRDMAGNVFEYANDYYLGTYYQYCVTNGIVNNPRGPVTGTTRVYRSGSFLNYPSTNNAMRVADRAGRNPTAPNYNIGFRCAR